jgi:hypothetical protein
MRRALSILVAAGIICVCGAAVLAEDLFKAADTTDKEPAKAASGPVDLKSGMVPALYSRLIPPIEARVAEGRKREEQYSEENSKEEGKRNPALCLRLQDMAAGSYTGAALLARKAMATAPDEFKAAIQEQYEKPNIQRAIDLYTLLAMSAHEKRDFKTAALFYKKILALDPNHEATKAAMTQLAEEYRTAMQQQKTTGGRSAGGGGDDDPKKSWEQTDYGAGNYSGGYSNWKNYGGTW